MKESLKKWLTLLLVGIVIFTTFGQTQNIHAEDNHGNLLEEIKSKGVIKMGVSPDYPPFEFTIRENGESKVEGLDVKLGEQIASDLGVKLEVVTLDFSNLLAAMEAGQIDMIISGMGATEEREKSVDFSEPYYLTHEAIVIRKEDADTLKNYQSFTSDKIIGYQQGSIQETEAQTYMKDAKNLTMTTLSNLVNALLSGQVDGVVMDDAVAGSHVAAHADKLTYINADFPNENKEEGKGQSVAIPKNQPELLAAINQTIQTAKANDSLKKWMNETYTVLASEDTSETGKVNWLDYVPYYVDGVKMTVFISIIGLISGTVLGFILAVMRLAKNKIVKGIATVYVEFIRGTPLMIQVLFMFLGIGQLFNTSALVSGLIAVSLNSAAYVCEIVRGGIQSVNKGQMEAARSLGLGYTAAMQKVIFPQALRSIWPALGNEFVSLIKESSIVSTIGIAELTFETRAVTSVTYQGIIPLLISMVLYFIMTFCLTKIMNHFEKQMNRKYA